MIVLNIVPIQSSLRKPLESSYSMSGIIKIFRLKAALYAPDTLSVRAAFWRNWIQLLDSTWIIQETIVDQKRKSLFRVFSLLECFYSEFHDVEPTADHKSAIDDKSSWRIG